MGRKRTPKKLRLEYVDVATLDDNPLNWRTHSDSQLKAIEDVIGEVGWAGALLYNERTKRLIDGHGRKKVCKGEVPVLIGSWTEEEERKILLTLDPIAAMAGASQEALGKLMENTKTQSEALADMLKGLAEEHGIKPEPGAPVDAEPQIDRAAELQKEWGTKSGDLWIVEGKAGEHRVLCGDSTKREDVEWVMGGEKAGLLFTDPPYKGNLCGGGFAATPKIRARVDKLKVSIADLYQFEPSTFLPLTKQFCADNASRFFFCNRELLFEYLSWAETAGLGWDILAWHKPNYLPMCGHHYYPDTEWLVKLRPKGATFNNGLPKETVSYGTYWIIPSLKGEEKEGVAHPTIKPLKIVCDCMSICSQPGEIVWDPFLGSGTTLIAAESLNRCCFGIEISAAYTAVILQRAKDCGLTPRLEAAD